MIPEANNLLSDFLLWTRAGTTSILIRYLKAYFNLLFLLRSQFAEQTTKIYFESCIRKPRCVLLFFMVNFRIFLNKEQRRVHLFLCTKVLLLRLLIINFLQQTERVDFVDTLCLSRIIDVSLLSGNARHAYIPAFGKFPFTSIFTQILPPNTHRSDIQAFFSYVQLASDHRWPSHWPHRRFLRSSKFAAMDSECCFIL